MQEGLQQIDMEKFYGMANNIENIKTNLQELVHTVNGNGKRGLKQDVYDLKTWNNKYAPDVERVLAGIGNKDYLKRGTVEIIRLVGFGTIVTLILRFM